MPSTASTRAQQLGEADARLPGQVAAVAVDVLAEQGDLAYAIGGQRLGLGNQLTRVATHLAPAGRGHDAVGALAVAAL